jgi:hypothetical protein
MLSSQAVIEEIKLNCVIFLTSYETCLYVGKYLYVVKLTNLIFIYLLMIRICYTQKLEIVVNEEFSKLCDWLDSYKLSLNPSKSNFDIFHLYQYKLVSLPGAKQLIHISKNL